MRSRSYLYNILRFETFACRNKPFFFRVPVFFAAVCSCFLGTVCCLCDALNFCFFTSSSLTTIAFKFSTRPPFLCHGRLTSWPGMSWDGSGYRSSSHFPWSMMHFPSKLLELLSHTSRCICLFARTWFRPRRQEGVRSDEASNPAPHQDGKVWTRYGQPPATPSQLKSAGAGQTHKLDGKTEQESLYKRGCQDGNTEGLVVWTHYGQLPAVPSQQG